MTLQQQIDALPQPGGGVVNISGRHTLTEPINLENKLNITLRGERTDTTTLVFQLNQPGPGVWMKGSISCRLERMSLMAAWTDPGGNRQPNVTATVLICRDDNASNGNYAVLDDVRLLGVPQFASLYTMGTDLLTLNHVDIRCDLDDTYGWYACGDKVPKYTPYGNRRPIKLTGPNGADVNGYTTAKGVRLCGASVFSVHGERSTAVHIEDHLDVSLRDVNVNQWPAFTHQPPKGHACLELDRTIDLLTVDHFHVEANDTRYALLVNCKPTEAFQHQCTPRIEMRGCRFMARTAIMVGEDAVFWPDPAWLQTNWLRSLDDLSRPVRYER